MPNPPGLSDEPEEELPDEEPEEAPLPEEPPKEEFFPEEESFSS